MAALECLVAEEEVHTTLLAQTRARQVLVLAAAVVEGMVVLPLEVLVVLVVW
jgi:hypothetical protein